MRLKSHLGLALLSTFALVRGAATHADDPAPPTEERAVAGAVTESPPAVTISKQTTYITEPLREDGYVDYGAALDALASADVTPENNAVVPLIKAVGPETIDAKIRDRFFERLGTTRLPDQGDYLVSFRDFLDGLEVNREERAEIVDEQRTMTLNRPWSAAEYPVIAQWVSQNEKPLQQAIAATVRPRCYAPLLYLEEPDLLISTLLPIIDSTREVARCLTARAMLRLQQGKPDAAWRNLLACHRLARLVAHGPTLIEGLVGMSIEQMACTGDVALAHFGNLDADRARRHRLTLDRLGSLPPMVDRIDIAERYMYLEAVCWIAKEGPAALRVLDGGTPSNSTTRSVERLLSRTVINWDIPLKMGNAWYDRLVAAARQPRGPQRHQALAEFDESIIDLISEGRGLKALAGSLLSGKSPRTVASEQVGKILISLLLPAAGSVVTAEDRADAYLQMAKIGFALAGYRATKGHYPKRLEDLVPESLAELPQDPFREGPYRYQPRGEGYVLYSVGSNQKDDGGQALGEEDGPPGADDLVVRVPGKTP